MFAVNAWLSESTTESRPRLRLTLNECDFVPKASVKLAAPLARPLSGTSTVPITAASSDIRMVSRKSEPSTRRMSLALSSRASDLKVLP